MRAETPQEIICTDCETVIGTVTMQPVAEKPGLFVNVCVPNPMPKTCLTCAGVVIRKPEGYVYNSKRLQKQR